MEGKPTMRLRQVALVAASLPGPEQVLCALLGVAVCFRDPAVGRWGLENSLLPLGGDFLELLAPTASNTTASNTTASNITASNTTPSNITASNTGAANTAAGRYLEKRGAGGYMVILQCADAQAARERIEALGVRVVFESRHPEIEGFHFHPADTGGLLLSVHSTRTGEDFRAPLSAWAHAGAEWRLAGGRAHPKDPGRQPRLAGAILQSPEPLAMAERWAALLDTPAQALAGDVFRIPTTNGGITIEKALDGRGVGLRGMVLEAPRTAGILSRAGEMGLSVTKNEFTAAGFQIRLQD